MGKSLLRSITKIDIAVPNALEKQIRKDEDITKEMQPYSERELYVPSLPTPFYPLPVLRKESKGCYGQNLMFCALQQGNVGQMSHIRGNSMIISSV